MVFVPVEVAVECTASLIKYQLSTNHAGAGVPDYEDAVCHPAMTALKWTAAALAAMLALPATVPIYRAPLPFTLPDKTSGFNGIAGYDLKV